MVDDEASVCEAVCDALPEVSAKVAIAHDANRAIKILRGEQFDVVLCDVYMPGVSGLELLKRASQAREDVGFILMTGKPQVEDIVAACRLHAADILLKPFSVPALHSAVEKAYARVCRARAEHNQRNQLRSGIRHRETLLADTRKQLEDSYREIIESMVMILDLREHETCAHSFRVRSYALYLAEHIGYPSQDMATLSTAALLHDIGKVAVPDQILLKPGRLEESEILTLQQHSVVGEMIASRSVLLRNCTRVIRHHHERWDGTGYPDRIAGEAIPLGARIFALADTLDAMTSDRCYRSALTLEQVHREVDSCSGKQFDPTLARAFQDIENATWIRLRTEADAQAASLNPLHHV